MDVRPMTCTLATRRHPSPTTTSGPMMQYGPIDAPAPIVAPGATRAVGSIALIAISYVVDDRADLALGYDLSGDLGFAAIPPHVLALGGLGHVVFDSVTRIYGPAEFCLVDGEKIGGCPRSLPAKHLHADDTGGLGHALNQ